ncbi:MAG: hypothetical protein JSW00_11920 [Thermoplasmata archaeon]|nr:MAG: hypothetical protein JSW00_11920 [Thermoplasmata archaeon]
MDRRTINFVSVLVLGIFVVASFAPIGLIGDVAAMGRQHNTYGKAYAGPDEGMQSPSLNTEISAWIDGVCYGKNFTSDTGEFDLYVEGDWWGIPENDSVKEGGYDGDEIQFFLDYDPSDYTFTIANWTSYFNKSDYEAVDLRFDTETDQDPGIGGDTHLRGLKINEIVLDPASGPQYLFIHDPGGDISEIELEDNYFLQKDNDTTHTPYGNIFNFEVNRDDVIQIGSVTPGINIYYINLTDPAFTLNTADEVKLVWRNPGTSSDGIANHTDVIVDRVEWGYYQNYISPTDPPEDRDYDNTTMEDCDEALLTDESYRRTPNGTDTDNCKVDFGLQAATGRPGVTIIYTVDWIAITTDSSGAVNLSDKSVVPGTQEWGFCAAFNASAPGNGFIGLVIGTWDVGGGNAGDLGSSPDTTHGIDVGSMPLVVVWLNVSYLGMIDTVMYTVTPANLTPGAPMDLRVHKGGGAWGGTTDDIVLNWTSPTLYWSYIKYNIIYYDSDLSNGFQYSPYLYMVPNSSTAGGEDGCILPGWLTDGSNYVFRVNTTNDKKGVFENMTGTNVGYKYGIVLDKTVATRLWVSIPYISDYKKASDITNDGFTDANEILVVAKWNYTEQRYVTRNWVSITWIDDFDIEEGDAIFIYVTASSYTWNIVGAHDPDFEFKLLTNPTTTDFKLLSLPYHRTYQRFSDITSEFPDDSKIGTVSRWNYTINRWENRDYGGIIGWNGDYDIYPSPLDAVMFDVTATPTYDWQPQVMGF